MSFVEGLLCIVVVELAVIGAFVFDLYKLVFDIYSHVPLLIH